MADSPPKKQWPKGNDRQEFDETLRRMLNTPPKPKRKEDKKKPDK